MGVHESKFCKICSCLYGDGDCEHEPPQADMLGLTFLPEYFEFTDEKGNVWRK